MTLIQHTQSSQLVKKILQSTETLLYLDQLERHHTETYNHSIRVGLLSIDMGYCFSFEDTELFLLGTAGVLHDVGKTQIPKELLSKKTLLTEADRAFLQEHPRFGYRLLENFSDPLIRKIVIAHHEYQPHGYPRQEQREGDERILALAQIIALSDLYDALAHPRAYKPAFSQNRVKELLEQQFTGEKKYLDAIVRRME